MGGAVSTSKVICNLHGCFEVLLRYFADRENDRSNKIINLNQFEVQVY